MRLTKKNIDARLILAMEADKTVKFVTNGRWAVDISFIDPKQIAAIRGGVDTAAALLGMKPGVMKDGGVYDMPAQNIRVIVDRQIKSATGEGGGFKEFTRTPWIYTDGRDGSYKYESYKYESEDGEPLFLNRVYVDGSGLFDCKTCYAVDGISPAFMGASPGEEDKSFGMMIMPMRTPPREEWENAHKPAVL